jgi:serine/threonine protein kinase
VFNVRVRQGETGNDLFGLQNLSGYTLGQYELRDLLGSGGMGAVYLGYQAVLERLVAIKVLNAALITDTDYLARFTREAKTSASLEHPHIVPVYDYGTQEGISYVVMRYLTGGSLAERLDHSTRTGRPLPSLSETAQIIRQLASALDYAHERGVIHRDVKTNNVMFDNQGTAFLVDFGIAKLTYSTSALTGTGMSVGTPSYMSPEQWRGEPVTSAADQYALAVTAYAMLTGRLPFEAETPFALMHKHLNEMPTPVQAFRGDLPEGVRDILSRALSKEPNARYESTSAFARDLETAVQGKGGAPTGFFLTPLPPKPKVDLPDHPTITPAPAPSPGKTMAEIPPVSLPLFDDSGVRASPEAYATEAQASAPRRPVVAGGVIVLAALLLVAGFVAVVLPSLRGNVVLLDATTVADGNGSSTTTVTASGATLTEEATLVAGISSDGTETRAATDTQSPSPTETVTSTSTHTSMPQPSATDTASPTETPTSTSTLTPTDTATLSVREAALATRDAFSTATATLWTITPTPDMKQTVAAELTAIFAEELTATATLWTATSTSTETATATFTATALPTDTPTNTATSTATFTSTSTRTPRPMATPTNTVLPTATIRVTQTPQPLAECPGVRPSRLAVGMEGYVLQDDARALNVRRGSGTSFSTLAQLQIGETFRVIEGPICGENFAWFRIEARSGAVIGWVAEGDEDSYFIAPSELGDPLTTFSLKPDCEIVLQDDFETDSSPNAWFTDSTERYVVDIFNGAYNLQINFLRDGVVGDPQGEGAPILWGSLSDYMVGNDTVEAVITSSLFTEDDDVRTGLWLRYQDEQNFLAFMMRGDGAYRIARYQDGVFTDLVDWTQNGAINTGDGATNTMRVELVDDTYTLYINGQFMATASDATWEEGRLAFWGASPRTPVTFALDYFRICAS